MRIYRWIILIILAGLTVIFLGTAVLAYQQPSTPPPGSINQTDSPRKTPQTIIILVVQEGGSIPPCPAARQTPFAALTWATWQPWARATTPSAPCAIPQILVSTTAVP